MRKLSLGAASVTALLLATAACGNNDDATRVAEVEAAADEDDDGAAYNDDETASNSDARASETYADARTSDTYGAGASQHQTVAADMSRSEIESLATRAFEGADADDDGVLDRDEYVQMALASARDFDTFVKEPVKLMSVSPVTNPEAMTTDGSAEVGLDADMDETGVTAMETTGVTLDAEQVAEIQTAAGENFYDAAGGDDALTAEELRASFLARFEEADQDGDDELNAAELRTFAALTRGE